MKKRPSIRSRVGENNVDGAVLLLTILGLLIAIIIRLS